MKTALKSVDFHKVTYKNKLAPFLWLTVYSDSEPILLRPLTTKHNQR